MRVHRRFYFVLLVLGVLVVAGVLSLKPRGDSVVYQGKPIRVWAIEARSGKPESIAALRRVGTNAVPGLADLMQRKESFVRRQLVAIGSKLPRRLRGSLLGGTSRQDALSSRTAAANALGLLGPGAELAIPDLMQALHDAEPQVSWEAAKALAQIGRPAVPELMRALADSNGYVRNCAAYALGQIGAAAEPAVPALIEALTDTNRDVRSSAAFSAAAIGAPSMLAISNVLDHGDANARQAALGELLRFQRSIRIPLPALARMTQAEEPALREFALAGLGALRVADNTTLNAVTNALNDKVPAVRVAAVKALKQMIWRAHEALPQLVQVLQDESPAAREWSAMTLGEIGPRAASALPVLKHLAETEPGLSPVVKEAIKKIELGQ